MGPGETPALLHASQAGVANQVLFKVGVEGALAP